MKPPRSPAGTETGADGAKVRRPSIHAGLRPVGKCGGSAQEVRKHTVPVLHALPSEPAVHATRWPAAAPGLTGCPVPLVRMHAPQKPREGAAGLPPHSVAAPAPMALIAREQPPDAGAPPAAGKVLTHPAFDRPAVHNERRRGPKAGAASLTAARRRKAAEALRIEDARATTDRGRIKPPSAGPGAASAGAALHTLRQAAAPLDLDARGLDPADRAVVDAALAVLGRYLRAPGALFDSPGATRDFMRLHLARWDRERFAVLFLDAQHRLIELEVMFEGTLAQTSVYPREVARRALHWNAASVILAHNHPSGCADPSRADEFLTQAIRNALAAVEVRVLDHLVVGWPDVTSLAERGLM
jgi:DNA repair protein RadC